MSRKVQSADGVIHEFPDGTPDTAIDKAMKEYAKTNVSEPAAPKNPFMGRPAAQLEKDYANHKLMGNKDLLPMIADARAKAEMDAGGFPYALGDSLRQYAKGVPIAGGLVDEGLAGAESLLGGNYDDALEAERARSRVRHEANPETALGMNLFGGVTSSLAAARALGAPAIGVNAARPLAQTALRGAAIGAPVGAADGFTRGEGGLENRAGSALVGGGLGLLGGAAAPIIGQGLATGYTNVRNALNRVANLRGTGMDPKVAGALAETLQGDDALGQALARIRQGGDDAMLVDAGPNAAGALDATIQVGGPQAVRVASAAVDQRASDAARRMTAEADRTFGQPVGARTQQQGIRDQTAGTRDQAYRGAYNQPIDYASEQGQQLEALVARVDPAAMRYANSLMRKEGLASRQVKFTENPDGTITVERLPDVRQWDYITQALNEAAYGQAESGAMGAFTRAGRLDRNLANQARGILRDLVPEYGDALAAGADTIGRINASKLGAQFLSPKVTRDEIAEELRGLTPQQRQEIRTGIRGQLDDAVANVRQMASEPNNDARELKKMLEGLTSRASREKVSLVMENPNDTLRFYREVGRAMRALELKAQVATNSRTAGRQATEQRMGDAFEPGPMGTAMQGEGPKAVKQVIQMMTGATKNQQRQAMNERWLELSRALTGPRGRDAEALFRRLIAANRVRGANALSGQRLGILGAGTVAGTEPTVNSRLFTK